MSRELELKKYCDICRIAGSPDLEEGEVIREPATTCYTIGIIEGESRPVPKVVDVCADHVGPLADLLTLLTDVHQLPGDVPKAAKQAKTVSVAAMKAPPPPAARSYHSQEPCAICNRQFATSDLTSHIWKKHRPDSKPPLPTRCPECGARYQGAGMASHRRIAHGYSSVADALSGVPGYVSGKPAGELTVNQLELTTAS